MTRGRLAVLAAAGALLAACGGGPADRGPARTASAGATAAAPPVRLSWTTGQAFRVSVEQAVTATTALEPGGGQPLATDLMVTAQETLTVRSVRDGEAEVEARVDSWRWGRSGPTQPAAVTPAPARLRVGPDGSIRSGRLWALPVDPPLPGVDFFSAGLPAEAPAGAGWPVSWTRTLDDDTALVYRGEARRVGAPLVVETSAAAHLARHGFAADGSPDVLEGDVQAVVRSAFDPGRRRLLSTSYTTTFTGRDSQPGGATRSQGRVTTTIQVAP
jgi:hypothetical protein